jgi:DTW domain-containing protein YfiP
LDGHCPQCYLRTENCLCTTVPKLRTLTEIVIVRHRAEKRLTSNTGRIAALCLENCRIIEYGGGLPFDESQLVAAGAALLFPGVSPHTPTPRPTRLIVLDATFRQARRMFKRISVLHDLPQLALAAPECAPNRLRQPPHPDGMSTIEAIAAGLSIVESPALSEPLLACYARFVERADEQRGRIRPDQPAAHPGSEDVAEPQRST